MKQLVAMLAIVCTCAFASSQAIAQADLGLKGAGVEVGMVSPEDLDATVGFGLFVDLGTIAPQFMLEGYFDFWKTSEDLSGLGEASARDIALGAKGKWIFRTSNPRIRPFAGGGLGLHFLHAEVDIPDQLISGFLIPGMTIEDDSVKLGLDFGGGMNVTLNERTDFIGELWYGVVSDVNQLSLKVGVLYKLGM
ncbi:MAG: outer membrane beta-barrel protein [Candidatus Krumholzibacteria bacterium]|nr:outer membrane beta-barrel protein [Candidatus Krumholzibacteria bacterium]